MADGGLDFPLDSEGKRSTTGVNQGAFAAAVARQDKAAHDAVVAEKKWRFGYVKHVVRQAQLAVGSPSTALAIAKDGLEYLHSTMEFTRGGKSIPLKDAMKEYTKDSFETITVKGGQASKSAGLEVPYKDKVLRGEELRAQIETWVRRGVIEFDTGAAMQQVLDTPGWLDLSDHVFVLFGAGSAMGPFPLLMAMGAHVIAIDLARPQIWKRLLATARNSPGTLTVPLKTAVSESATDDQIAEVAGCDLLGQTPEVRNWLLKLVKEGHMSKRLVLGAYCYADGPLFVRVSMAMDAVIADLIKQSKERPALAYLCTPTDVHVCSSTAKTAAADNLRKAEWWQPLAGSLLRYAGMGLSPNKVSGESALPLVDALVKEQGPNYCLAKRLQHWRAILSREDGCVVSSNIAPATATASVVSNKSFALAYKGMHFFRPMEVFQQETSNAVMATLLVNDLRNELSAASPKKKLENPMQLFAATAFHGGAWRTGYKFGTIGPASAIAYITTAFVVKAYLVLYNVVQLLGWSLALFYMTSLDTRKAEPVIDQMTYLQIAEVLHAAIGLVPSNPVITAMQIGSRVAAVQTLFCGLSDSNRSTVAPWENLFFVAWSITEVVRYSYLALNTAGIQLSPLTWLRYSTFLLLYPLGVTGELGMIVSVLPALAAKKPKDCSLSGSCGKLAAFILQLGVVGCFIIYAACFPMLFGTLLGQRKKILGRAAGKDSGKKKA